MGTQAKGLVQVVLPKNRKDGTPAWSIIVTGVEPEIPNEGGTNIEFYDSKGNFKDKKQGEEIHFEWSPSQDGNIKFINPIGGGFTKGGGGRGKSPEELALQRKAFALSYAKDQIGAVINGVSSQITLPEKVKLFEFMELLRQSASIMTIRTAKEFIAVLEAKD